MNKERRFELPGYQDLSKDQDDALALPKTGRHLVIGGPGTGKSVVALLRTLRHQKDNDDYYFLVYNHTLHKACSDMVRTKINSTTYLSWFFQLYHSMVGEPVPTLEPEPNKTWRPVDWDSILNQIRANSDLQIDDPPTILIDEGQDMPSKFYASLLNMGFDKFFVVADQNQQINPKENSSRQDIEDNLVIDIGDVIELKYNFRNTYEIALLARHFYTDKASLPPDLPQPTRRSPRTPILFEYDDRPASFRGLMSRILKTVDVRPNRLIGIICHNNKIRERYYRCLLEVASQKSLDNGIPSIETYSYGQDVSLNFDTGGIMVINQKSCKGLEFDYVFLADIDQYTCQADNPDSIDQLRKDFYVMVARAREHLIMLKVKGRHCPAEEHILPKDEAILSRESQNG